ncbi:MAG: LPS export ABC transporter periplasmic protein LptC [Pyrinomonadaceae bacterium]
MAAENTNHLRSLHFRAQLPKYLRVAAIASLALTLIAVGIGYYRAKSNTDFRMKAFPTALSKDVVASVSGYERRESDGDTAKYYIKADTATTFSDNHQELENVYLQVFADGDLSDEITAQRAVYIPEENKNFTGYFAGDVIIKTRDQLKLRTQQVTYTKSNEMATADEHVEFERHNIRGSSFGGSLNIPSKTVSLNRDVNFEVNDSDGKSSKMWANSAVYDQAGERIQLSNEVRLEMQEPNSKQSTARAERAVVMLSDKESAGRSLERVELYSDVFIEQIEGSKTVSLRSKTANFHAPTSRYELDQDVSIESFNRDKKLSAAASNAVYETAARKITLSGNASIEQRSDYAKGDKIIAELYPQNILYKLFVIGNGHLHQPEPESVVDINSGQIDAVFGEDGIVNNASSIGQSEVVKSSNDKSRLSISAASGITAKFHGQGLIGDVASDGRTTIRLDVPDNGSDSANKSVSADVVNSKFQADGKNLQHTEAIGNAIFTISPHHASTANYNTQIEAPRFDCDFFNGMNNPRICNGSSGTKTIRTPTVQREGRGEQVILSERLSALFDQRSGNIAQIDSTGKGRFAELDKKGIADSFNYTTVDEVVRLRGGEPTIWDSRARIKAKEIDWDTKNSRSVYRKAVNTTYYSPKGMRSSAPFGDESKPVYITAENAELDHVNETADYSGNARGWQGNNYVRAEKINIRQKDSQMSAAGNVQSLLYKVKKAGSGNSATPVFAAANEMYYDGTKRTIQYSKGVDIRQGQDRITGATALIYLDERNELLRTDAETGVAIIQSGRKAYADLAVYTAADDKLMLRGRPAKVEDTEKGTAQGEELVIFLSDNRTAGEGKSKTNPAGRVRSSYKVK